MNSADVSKWGQRLDKVCLWAGALLPVGIVIGNIGYELMLNTAILCWLMRCFLVHDNGIKTIFKHPFAIPWVAWYGVILASNIWNGPGTKGIMHDVIFIRFVLFGLAIIDISQRHPVGKYFTLGLMAGVAFAAINTLLSYIVGFDLFGRSIIRYTQKVKEASRIAPIAAFAAPFFWGLATDGKVIFTKEKIAYAGTFIVSSMLLFLTNIRTALVGALIGTLFLVGRSIQKRLNLGFAVLFCTMILFIFISYGSRERLIDLSSLYDRIYYWKVAFVMWLENPILGVGVSSFREAYHQIAESGVVSPFEAPNGIIYEQKNVTHAHNLFFMLISCTGIIGTVAFSWLLYRAIREIWEGHSRYRPGLLTWPIVFITIGVTGWNIFGSWHQSLFAYFMAFIGSEFTKITLNETKKLD